MSANRRKLAAAAILAALLNGCSTMSTPPPVTRTAYDDAAALAREKKYPEASAAYKKIQEATPQAPYAGDALYAAALLQLAPDNPLRDYSQAMRAFEEFVKQYPDHARIPEALNWIALLRANADLKKDNEKLKKNIEQLKQLDIRHEERRRK